MPSPHSETDPTATVAFRTVGCRLNQCETAQMQEALATTGFKVVDWAQAADIRVINTCTVTSKSDRTCRHEIHAARRMDPDCVLAVTGCLAQVSPDVASSVQGVDIVLGNPDKRDLARHLKEALRRRLVRPAPDVVSRVSRTSEQPLGQTRGPYVSVSPYTDRPVFEEEPFAHFRGRTRAFLKVQNGCDSRCSYCIVPSARGPARSMSAADVVRQVRLLASQGYREVVLTGIDLGSWGKDTGEGTLSDLLTLTLKEVPELGRLRLSSVEPLELDTALLDATEKAGKRMAHHFHLPLQSGSDTVLTAMNRPYSATQYLTVVREVAERLPGAAIGADIIVGFPGETESDFEKTLALVETSPLTYLHVFGYSDRAGTRAAGLQPKVKPEVIKERSERLRQLGAHKKETFRDSLVGNEQRVLVLDERADDGHLVGLTGNYMEVLVDYDEHVVNRFVTARLEQVLPSGRWEVTILEREG